MSKEISNGVNYKFFKFAVLPVLLAAGFFVSANLAQAALPIEPDDLAIWHFDENSGDIAYDTTANHYNLNWDTISGQAARFYRIEQRASGIWA